MCFLRFGEVRMVYIVLRIYSLISLCYWSMARTPELPSSEQALHVPTNFDLRHDDHGYEIISEEIVYSRWRSILNRRIRHPKDGKIVEYDVSQ